MSPSALEPTRDQNTVAVGLQPAADTERRDAGAPGQPPARLQQLFRHAGDGPDSRFLQDLVTQHRKLAAA